VHITAIVSSQRAPMPDATAVVRKNWKQTPVYGSSSNQCVFVMQSTEDWIGTDRVGFSASMTRCRCFRCRVRAIGNTWASRHVGAPSVVMFDPRTESAPQVRFRHGNEPVQTLSANGPNHSLADRICHGATWW